MILFWKLINDMAFATAMISESVIPRDVAKLLRAESRPKSHIIVIHIPQLQLGNHASYFPLYSPYFKLTNG